MKSITVPPLCWSSIDCPESCAERIGVICLYIHEKKNHPEVKSTQTTEPFFVPFHSLPTSIHKKGKTV